MSTHQLHLPLDRSRTERPGPGVKADLGFDTRLLETEASDKLDPFQDQETLAGKHGSTKTDIVDDMAKDQFAEKALIA